MIWSKNKSSIYQIGKMVRSKGSKKLNEYEIIIRGINQTKTVFRDIVISDFLPKGFKLVSDSYEDPSADSRKKRKVKRGVRWQKKKSE